MARTPTVPEDSTPPWPANPLPHTLDATTVRPAPKTAVTDDKAAPKANIRKIAGVGAAVGIGSAAIVAALMYTSRRKGSVKG